MRHDEVWHPSILPTHAFHDKHTLEIAGVTLELIHAPGETDDQIVVFMKEGSLLCAADNFYEAFPNLYAIRGVPYRDPQKWVKSLILMRKLGAEILVPSHTLPVIGAAEVARRLQNYGDAISFVHDQTVRRWASTIFTVTGFFPNSPLSFRCSLFFFQGSKRRTPRRHRERNKIAVVSREGRVFEALLRYTSLER